MRRCVPLILLLLTATTPLWAGDEAVFKPGARSLAEAHNCYPYGAFYADRIDIALAQPTPIAIELDVRWHRDAEGGGGRLIVAHDPPPDGFAPPTLEEYAFEALRPHVEAALASGDTTDWPLYTLNINDMRGGDREMFDAAWDLANRYEHWLCTAEKGADSAEMQPMQVGPVLLLAGGGEQQTRTFYDQVPVGGRLLIFGRGSPDDDATNFRRWTNYAWSAVEPGGPPRAGEWTQEDAERLQALVDNAHARGYWIRFFSLNGHGPLDVVRQGWSPGYNFGSLEAAEIRWRAAFEAGVDFLATDQIAEASALWQKLRDNAEAVE